MQIFALQRSLILQFKKIDIFLFWAQKSAYKPDNKLNHPLNLFTMLINLGKSIKKIRTIKGMTQADVAEKLHITAEAYSKIENGKTKLDTNRLEELAKIYGVSVQDIYAFDDKKIFVNHSPAAINGTFIQNDNTDILNLLKEIIQEKNTLIADQKTEIQLLKQTIADLNAQK